MINNFLEIFKFIACMYSQTDAWKHLISHAGFWDWTLIKTVPIYKQKI